MEAKGADVNPIVPTHHLEAFQSGMGTRTSVVAGQLVDRGNCIYLVLASRQRLVVWPSGTTIDEAQDPRVVRDANGKELARMGESYSMDGISLPTDRRRGASMNSFRRSRIARPSTSCSESGGAPKASIFTHACSRRASITFPTGS